MFEKNPDFTEPNTSETDILSNLPDFDTHLAEISAKNPEMTTNSETTANQELNDNPDPAEDPERAEDPEKLANLKKFTDFLERDLAVKQALASLAPNSQDFYSEESTISYADKIYDGLKDISSNLETMMREYYPSRSIEDRLAEIQENLVGAGANPHALSEVYRHDFTDMSADFVKNVEKEAVGYTMFNSSHSLDREAKSINEILHLIHSSVVNNENILQSLPVLDKGPAGEVTLYGAKTVENPIAREIFDGLKDDDYATDIVSLENRTLMMVRDRGHALTLDIARDPDGKYYTNYFIPKICNVDKVNLLPGVRPVTKKPGENQIREATTGVFAANDASDVAPQVLDFISRVPTDDDMVF